MIYLRDRTMKIQTLIWRSFFVYDSTLSALYLDYIYMSRSLKYIHHKRCSKIAIHNIPHIF